MRDGELEEYFNWQWRFNHQALFTLQTCQVIMRKFCIETNQPSWFVDSLDAFSDHLLDLQKIYNERSIPPPPEGI